MQTVATSLPPGAMSFAGALASAADPPWTDDGLADDVATISYEHALRNHGRAHSLPDDAQAAHTGPAPAEGGCRSDSFDTRPLKTASITIRLSEPDCRQVRKRAAESGLTVSAYLRSCTLEVESLRAQVKGALAELRNVAAPPVEESREPRGTQVPGTVVAVWQWFRRFASRRRPAIRLNPANPFAPLQ